MNGVSINSCARKTLEDCQGERDGVSLVFAYHDPGGRAELSSNSM